MSWYSEEKDGETKRYLEWYFDCLLEPDEEPGFYRPKGLGPESGVPAKIEAGQEVASGAITKVSAGTEAPRRPRLRKAAGPAQTKQGDE